MPGNTIVDYPVPKGRTSYTIIKLAWPVLTMADASWSVLPITVTTVTLPLVIQRCRLAPAYSGAHGIKFTQVSNSVSDPRPGTREAVTTKLFECAGAP